MAVVGAGIYGISVSTLLAEHHDVDLFEANSDILMGASMVNQHRLHRGYHYPRSPETVEGCLMAEQSFLEVYGDAVIHTGNQFYAIAKEDSKTSKEAYLTFCKSNHLAYKNTTLSLLNSKKIDLTIQVEEKRIDHIKLKHICRERLAHSGIRVFLNKKVELSDLTAYDQVIVCTYSALNNVLQNFQHPRQYQFEVCEKIVVQLPTDFKNISVVVMDGPFMCIDPYGKTNFHLLGNVQHAIHSTNIGIYPKIPKYLEGLINGGLSQQIEISHFEKFIDSAKHFFPGIIHAQYRGSMFTVRAVLPKKDKTDERPTIVKKINDKVITVFSGKIGNCVEAAIRVQEIIDKSSNR